MQKNVCDGCMRIKQRGEPVEDERGAENGADVIRVGEAGHDFRVKYAEKQSGHSDDEAEEGAGSADVEERAFRSNRRANHDEGAEGSNQRWKGDEIGVSGMNVMGAGGGAV